MSLLTSPLLLQQTTWVRSIVKGQESAHALGLQPQIGGSRGLQVLCHTIILSTLVRQCIKFKAQRWKNSGIWKGAENPRSV